MWNSRSPLKNKTKLGSSILISDGKMGRAVEIQHLKASWSQRQVELQAAGLNAKEAHKLHTDQRRLTILDSLKQEGGPFTTAEEVDSYLCDDKICRDSKAKRMRKEVTFARHISITTTLSSGLQNIQHPCKTKKVAES